MFDGFLFVLGKSECVGHHVVALDQLAGSKSYGHVGLLAVVFGQVHDGVQASVDGPSVVVGVTKVLALGAFLEAGDVQGMLNQFVDALVLHGRNGHDGHAQ